jgi:hypothetical protein
MDTKHGVMPHVFTVTSEEQRKDKWMPFVNSNYPRDAPGFTLNGASDWPVLLQLGATTAAPTFFPPAVHPSTGVQYVDGGISANNPSSIALQEARALWPGRPIGCLVSLGTGKTAASEGSKTGVLYWAGKILSLPTDSYRIHKETKASLSCQCGPELAKPCYFRLEPVIPDIELDESREPVLNEMKRSTAAYIASKAAKVDRLCSAVLLLSGDAHPPMSQMHRIAMNQMPQDELQTLLRAAGGSLCTSM